MNRWLLFLAAAIALVFALAMCNRTAAFAASIIN